MLRNMIIQNTSRIIPALCVLFYFIVSASSCNKEVSVTPPDSPPPNGYIFINSNPPGFNIYLNNMERRRATPDSLTWLSTGIYLITLEKDLFKDTSISVSIVEGVKKSLFVDFTQDPSMKGNINCTSIPSNAEILINDSSTGLYTPCTISVMPGYYYIKYRFKNYRDDSVLTTVSSGNTSSANSILVDTALWQDYTTSNSGITTDILNCVAVDKNNIIWVGSSIGGYLSFNGTTWQTYYNSLSNTIDCITVDANNIKYIGTTRGLVVINSGTSTHEYGFMSSGLPDYHINALAVDNNGNCYIGTNASITQFPGWADYTPSNGAPITIPITSLVLVGNNNIWAGIMNYGIAEGFPLNSWQFYTTYSANIISDNITALAASPTGEVWAGFANESIFGNGLCYFDGSSWNKVYPIPSSSSTNTIFIDRNNVKWVGTNQGLIKFSSPSSVTTFNYNNTGLNITNVTGISQDSFGNIWIATSSGLFKYKGNH